jgi:hypothetical protein
MDNKAMKLAVLDGGEPSGDAQITAITHASDGAVQKRVNLFAPSLRIDPAEGLVSVPGAGRMLYENLTPAVPTTQPGDSWSDASGTAAFEWNRELILSEKSLEAQMAGDVVVVHRQTPDAPLSRMESQRVVATFERSVAPTTAPDAPADTGKTPQPTLSLIHLTADGGVHMTSEAIRFDSLNLDYDPASQTLSAGGDDMHPVLIYDSSNRVQGSLRAVRWNTLTRQITLREAQLRARD